MQYFLVAVVMVAIAVPVFWYVDKKWEKEKYKIETFSIFDPNDQSKKIATFAFEKRYQIRKDNMFNVYLSYPNEEPNFNENSVRILVSSTESKNKRIDSFLKEISIADNQLIQNLKKNESIKFLDKKAFYMGALDEVLMGADSQLIFKFNVGNTYLVLRSLHENIDIQYQYEKNLKVSLSEMDKFVIFFIKKHMIDEA